MTDRTDTALADELAAHLADYVALEEGSSEALALFMHENGDRILAALKPAGEVVELGSDIDELARTIDSFYEDASNNPCTCNIDENACRYCSACQEAERKTRELLAAWITRPAPTSDAVRDVVAKAIITTNREGVWSMKAKPSPYEAELIRAVLAALSADRTTIEAAALERAAAKRACEVPYCQTFGCQGALAPHCAIRALKGQQP